MLKILLFIAVVLCVAGVEADACTCLMPKNGKTDVRKSRDEASSVFVGRVVEIRKHEKVVGEFGLRIAFETIFAVSRAWKGVTQERVRVFTNGDSAMCGRSFEVGKEYLVYGVRSDEKGAFSDNLCSRTKLTNTEGIMKEIKYLGKLNYSTSKKG